MQVDPARLARLMAWALLTAALLAVTIAWLLDLEMDLVAMLEQARRRPDLLWTAAAVYALCLAIPYMPGLELGVLLMLVFGRPGVLAAYLGTLVGLNLGYLAGIWVRRRLEGHSWLLPWRARAAAWDGDGMTSGSRWAERIRGALRQRGGLRDYLLVGLLFNVPGNWVIGGGGGIALVSGLSGRLTWRGYSATVALATCLVPLAATFGVLDLQSWLQALRGLGP